MKISDSQLAEYWQNGYLVFPDLFSPAEMNVIEAGFRELKDQDPPGKIMENDGIHIRTIFGCHEWNDTCERLGRHPRLVEPALQMIGEPVYIHQFKINVKAAFCGDLWQWHQDYIFWQREDGMERPDATTAALFLDDVTEFNGPLLIIPGSHCLGVIDIEGRQTAPGWRASVGTDLKYSLSPALVADLVTTNGIVAPKGPRGTVLFFHCNAVHGSVMNMSPFDRRMAFVSYNAVGNRLLEIADPRPQFMANRRSHELTAVADDTFAILRAGDN